MCDDATLSLNHFQVIYHCWIHTLLQRIWHSQRCCLCNHVSNYFYTNNQVPCSPFFHSCVILRWNSILLYHCFRFPCFCFSRNQMLCDHICHICCTNLWRTCYCFDLFIQSLMLEPYLWDLVFLVSCFHLTLFFRTNGFISWGPCMPSSKCWYFKILSQICIILVRHQIHMPSSNLHLSHIFPSFYWTSNINYIFHWTICQSLVLWPLSCLCSTCL